MGTIKEHLETMLDQIGRLHLDNHVTEGDEATAVNKLELAVHEARQVFERRKDLDK